MFRENLLRNFKHIKFLILLLKIKGNVFVFEVFFSSRLAKRFIAAEKGSLIFPDNKHFVLGVGIHKASYANS